MARSMPIAAVMTPGPAVLDELATAQEALSLMAQRGYHQVMVTRDGRLVGVVSIGDVVKIRLEAIETEHRALREYIASA